MNRAAAAAGAATPHPIQAAIGVLACPICGLNLQRRERQLLCTAGHTFDLARQGYVNLLRGPAPPNADTAQMVAARERFMASGAYAPICDGVVEACAGAARVAEVGAGPGYYLSAVVDAHIPRCHLALDVSVAAARRSSRLGLATAVADTWAGLPVRNTALDVLLCVFAPRNPREFARVLASGGRAIVVTPNPGHLAELRTRLKLLDVPADKLTRLDASFAAAGLHLDGRTSLEYHVSLSPRTTADLVAMGPNAFHHPTPVPDEVSEVQVSVTISSFRAHRPVRPRASYD